MTKLTEFQKLTTIPQEINRYFAETGGNQAQLSRDSKVGEAYVSQIMQGKTHIGTTEIKDKYYLDLCKTIGFTLKIEVWRHFNTQNFKQIIPKIIESRKDQERFTIDGDTGSGKSHACREYKMKFPVGTYLVTCSAVENSKEFAKNIAEVVGVESFGTAGTIIKKVIKKLENEDNAILIIDESEHIGKKSGYVNIIKSLADGLDRKVSFGIVGMGINKILIDGYEKNKQNFRQTARRFCNRETLEISIREDIYKTCEEIGIKEDNVKKWFADRVRNFGELEVYVKKAFKEAEKSGEKITVSFLNTLDF